MTESLSRLTSIFESAKDLTIEAAVSASSRLADTPSGLRPQEISKLLNSRVERDVLNGMKYVISMMSRGEDGLMYFADIVKNITSANSKVRNLVLVYITRYAELEPDTALLSINSIQKSLSDKNPISRANSIKSLSGIRIPSISPILVLCIKRTVNDNSPLVRASTAIAIGKIYEIDKSNTKTLLEYLNKLLADKDPHVVGTTIKAYAKLLPHISSTQKKWAPIHGHFRRFCKILNEFDEWAQATVIELLTDYCRLFLPRPKLYTKDEGNLIVDLPNDLSALSSDNYEVSYDEDLKLFVEALKDLCYTNSDFVLLSIVRSLISLTPTETIKEFDIASILCGMMTNSHNNQLELFALEAISMLSQIDKRIFLPHYRRFYILPSDSVAVANLKLSLLSQLVNESNIKYVIEELKYNALESTEPSISNGAIKAIGRCSRVSNEWNEKILKWCLKNVRNTNGQVLNELLTVIRLLIQNKQELIIDDSIRCKEISKIVYNLSLILYDETVDLAADAKASIIWIIGEFTKESNNEIAPDILRILLKDFANEPEAVRYQCLVLAAKLYSITLDNFKNSHENDPETIQEFIRTNIVSKMFSHTLTLSKYDPSYDTRDRARMFNMLLNSGELSQLASLFLQAPKPPPIVTSAEVNYSQNKILVNFFKVPDWADQNSLPPASIRKELPVQDNQLSGGAISSGISNTISKKIGEIPNTNHSITSQQFHKNPNKVVQPSYQLQSLDEFFGSEEEEDEDEDDEDDEEDDDDEDDDDEDDDDEDDLDDASSSEEEVSDDVEASGSEDASLSEQNSEEQSANEIDGNVDYEESNLIIDTDTEEQKNLI